MNGGLEVGVLLELRLSLEVDRVPDELTQPESDVDLGLGEDLVLLLARALDILDSV